MLKQTLILTPTSMERQILKEHLPSSIHFELSGFGPIAAGIATMRYLKGELKDRSIQKVILIGLGGTYDEDLLPVGTAHCFRHVSLWGVGADTDSNFQLPSQMKLPQVIFDDGRECFETLALDPLTDSRVAEGLLTVTSASGDRQQASLRQQQFPQCHCEDMEGFSVAMAAHLESRSLTIIRGISNVAGDRNKSDWNIPEALQAAAELLKSGADPENDGDFD